MGMPKALMRHANGRSWLETSVGALTDGGCAPVAVVLGAAADRARAILGHSRELVILDNTSWSEGIGSSLRLALQWCLKLHTRVEAATVMLVDTPGINARVVRHMLSHANGADVLARAVYGEQGEPGHPVLLGRTHWAPICEVCGGDEGAKGYLSGHPTRLIDCSAYGHGDDIDARSQGPDCNA